MSELAFNINGEAFEVPANAAGWRVRKMRAKGSPEVVYAREGQPLVLPISAEIADLRAEVDTTGRYRLDLVDQNNKPIEGAPSGYVQINFEVDAIASEPASQSVSLGTPTDNIVIEAMRMNSEIAKSVVDRFPQMLEAAATLLRAADGAGLPAREGRAVLDDDGGDDDGEPSLKPSFDLNALVAQVVPMLVMGLGNGKLKMPQLNEVLDWRKAKPAKQAKLAPAPETVTTTDDAKPATTDTLPPIDPQTMQHFIAVQSALQPDEATMAREVASTLSPAELRAWFDELSKLSVPQAVQKIRVLIAGNTEAVS